MSGSIAIVTGGGTHLGAAISESLCELGATVIVASRNLNNCKEMSTQLTSAGLKAYALQCDATIESDVNSLIKSVIETHGKLDVFVCNAGGSTPDNDFPSSSTQAFRDTISMNIDTTFMCAQAAAKVMIKQGHGKIITIGSVHGVMGTDKRLYEGLNHKRSSIGYFAAKGGVINLTKALAAELGEHGITVNCISPGQIPKPTVKKEMINRMVNRQPIGKMGKPHDLKGAAALFASPAGNWITGQNLIVDGGWTIF
jgi:NAD(P)-dependent dehydrogenase (short-subunit alcohol dehydrogenase family)